MTCTYGGIPCLDPAQELANCRQLGYPTPWAGVANSFACPQGQDYGRGRVLMLRGDLLSINLNAFYPLVFSDGTRSVTLKQVLFVRAYCATPGGRGDPSVTYVVELADKRLLCHQPIDRGYNVRSTPGGAYYSATLNSGTPWTWSQMVADIWFTVNKLSGTFPGLPFVPNGTPEGWAFWGSDAFDALGRVLDRLGCALDYNPVTDTFSIVRLGATDQAASAALTAVDPACVWDSDPIEGARAGVPAVLRVFFTNQRDAADSTGGSPYTFRDATDLTAGGPLPGTDPNRVALVYDDLPAIYTAGVLTNGAALTARATERAADYFRRARQTRLYRGYTGGYGATGLLPGAQLTATIWRDTGGGLFTEVVRLPVPGDDLFAGAAGETPGGGTGAAGDPGATGAAGGTGAPGATGPAGGAVLLPPGPVNGWPPITVLPPWFFNVNYLYQVLYNSFSVSLGGGGGGSSGIEVKNLDNTQDTLDCTVFRANNDLGTGLLKWVTDGAGTGYLSWMGLQLYKAGFGLVGPETILEIQDDGGTIGVLATISDDAASGRVVLKYSWKGLTLQVSGTDYGPERKLSVVPGTGISVTGADDGASNRTVLTVTNTQPYPGPSASTGAGAASEFTGTTVDAYATVFDSTSGGGLIGAVILKNTGATGHALTWQITAKDMYGTSGSRVGAGLSPGAISNWSLLSDLAISGVNFPYQQFKLEVKSNVAGLTTTYDCWRVLAN